jgi:starch synthase
VRATPVVGGVNPALFHPLRDGEAERRPPERFTVLTNGRFSRRRKGTRLVARALDRLARRERGLELRLFDTSTVGHRAGLPPDFRCRVRVRFHLDVPRDRLRRLYGSSDVYVSAEKKAGWSNMSIEAMACGVPVVCTASGTRDFAVDGETALVVPRRAGAIARAVRRLRNDAALRDRLAAAGRERALELTWERTAERLAEVLEAARAREPG